MGCSRLGTGEDKAAVQKEIAVSEARCVAPDCTGSEVRAAYERGGMPAVRMLQAEKEAQLRAASFQAWNWGSPTTSINSWGSPPAPTTHNVWSASPPVSPPSSSWSGSSWSTSPEASPLPPWSAGSGYSSGGVTSNPEPSQYGSLSGGSSGSVSPPAASTPSSFDSSVLPKSPPSPLPPAAIDHRTALWQPEYWRGDRFVDPKAWNHESELVMYRDQANNRVLGVEGWLQQLPGSDLPTYKPTRDQIKGAFADDPSVHIAHCFAKCFGGPVYGNVEPFEGTANLAISVLEKEIRAIANDGISLYVQGVFHYDGPADAMPDRHEISVYCRDFGGTPRLVGKFEVHKDGSLYDLRSDTSQQPEYMQ